MFAGSYVDSKKETDGEKFREKTYSITNGIVDSYSIIEEGEGYVIIKAEVSRNKDHLVKNDFKKIDEDKIESFAKNRKKQREYIRILDNISEAIIYDVDKTKITEYGLEIYGHIRYSNNWKIKYRNFIKITDGLTPHLYFLYERIKIRVRIIDGENNVIHTNIINPYSKIYIGNREPRISYFGGLNQPYLIKIEEDLSGFDRMEIEII